MSGYPAAAAVQIEEGEFELLEEVIGLYAGVTIAAHRRAQLGTYVRSAMTRLGLASLAEYRRYLRYARDSRRELNELVRIVTINETYFFRERHHFDSLSAVARDDMPIVRVLSAGCSSGEEAYSISIATKQALQNASVAVDAFDINPDRIDTANEGTYRCTSLRSMEPSEIARHFDRTADDCYRIKERYRPGVRFSVGNILELASYPSQEPYDFIFCRNVLIYFADCAVRTAVAHFASLLKPGALLFLGHSESIIGVSPDLVPHRLGSHIVYRRSAAFEGDRAR